MLYFSVISQDYIPYASVMLSTFRKYSYEKFIIFVDGTPTAPFAELCSKLEVKLYNIRPFIGTISNTDTSAIPSLVFDACGLLPDFADVDFATYIHADGFFLSRPALPSDVKNSFIAGVPLDGASTFIDTGLLHVNLRQFRGLSTMYKSWLEFEAPPCASPVSYFINDHFSTSVSILPSYLNDVVTNKAPITDAEHPIAYVHLRDLNSASAKQSPNYFLDRYRKAFATIDDSAKPYVRNCLTREFIDKFELPINA